MSAIFSIVITVPVEEPSNIWMLALFLGGIVVLGRGRALKRSRRNSTR